MPLRSAGNFRKRWRYVGVYGKEVMVCAARAWVGPFGQSFWSVWDRGAERTYEHTRLRPGRGAVRMEGRQIDIAARDVHARLTLGDAAPIESICPSGSGWGWTRKRAGVPVTGSVETPGGLIRVDALGVDDESAGYQSRRTRWSWSAGVGRSVDGRSVAWNLVEGINDPPRSSERAIWVEGEPHEPDPVEFENLEGVRFADRGLLSFAAGPERARDDDFLVFRSTYRHLFGEFAGSLDGLELSGGFGVMERHDALW